MTCRLCGRSGDDSYFEKHHLFPIKTRRDSTEMETLTVCHQCGDQIHLMFTNQQLRIDLNNLANLTTAMKPYIEWVRTKPLESHFSVAKKKRHN